MTTEIYIIYKSEENIKAFHNGLIRLKSGINSKIVINIINLINHNSINILTIDNKLDESSNVKYNIVDMGGKESITNYYSNLKGAYSKNTLNTIYMGKDDEKIDLNYIAECFGEKSDIKIEVQGALKDNAIKKFKGTIDFKKGAKKAIGSENENCLLLSDKAKSIALPMLLCSEEDVEGEHSASSGKASQKSLFYIMSRGFSKQEAEKLLVRANFNKIIEEIKDTEIKEKIVKIIDEF